jgi:hypothetical protein
VFVFFAFLLLQGGKAHKQWSHPSHNDPYLGLYRVVAAHHKKDDSLNCRTSSLDIFVYHADFHEGHGTFGAWQGRGRGTAWYVWISLWRGIETACERHGMCELAFNAA